MINSSIFLEKFLQNYRFKKVKPYLVGDVLDFGGNDGELKEFVAGKYLCVNYDHSALADCHCDTIVSLAVIEHIDVAEVYALFEKFRTILNPSGRIFLTTPTKIAEPVLKIMAAAGIIDKKNIAEHRHYWNKKEIYELAEKTGFTVKRFAIFQLIFNQLAVFEHL